MTATKKDIVRWLDEAQELGAAFLIIGLDPFDHDNFPIPCKSAEICLGKLKELRDSGNSYDEVYDFSLSVEEQLAERRAMHIPK